MDVTTTTDTSGASKYTGIAVSTLQHYRVFGTGPKFCKLGSRVVYRLTDLDEWIASRVVSSTSEKIAV